MPSQVDDGRQFGDALPNGSVPSKLTFYAIYAIIAIDWVNYGIVFPLLPSVAKRFGVSAFAVGLLPTGYALAQIASSPVWGKVSDQYGRRPVLAFSVCGSIAANFITAIASSLAGSFTNVGFGIVVFTRILAGAMGGTAGIANAFIADICPEEKDRAEHLAYAWAANSLGILIGPIIGGFMLNISGGCPSAFLTAAGMSVANLALCVYVLVEPGGNESNRQGGSKVSDTAEMASGCEAAGNSQILEGGTAIHGNSKDQNPNQVLQEPLLRKKDDSNKYSPLGVPALMIYGSRFLVDLGYAAFETVMGYYIMDTFFNGDPIPSGQFFGYVFIAAGIAMLVSTTFLYKPVLARFDLTGTLLLGAVLRTIGWASLPVAGTVFHSKVLFVTGFAVNAIGGSLMYPTQSAALSGVVSESDFGTAFGYKESSGALAGIVGPAIAGFTYTLEANEHEGHAAIFFTVAALNIVAAGLIYANLKNAGECENNID